MKQCQALQMQRMADAQKKLGYLKEASSNVDMLQAEEIVNLRKQIVKRLADRAAEGIGVE
jgi:phage terminase Nu1 subunit (DNA packaging protein)